jgi:hypothetical protein
MPIYSKNICLFIQEIKKNIKTILINEIKVAVRGDRFHNFEGSASYPISVVIYNNRKELGYFDPNFYELGFHECLMHTKKEQLRDTICHELAHYLTYIYHPNAPSHGIEFRSLCQKIGWGETVSRACTYLELDTQNLDSEDFPVFRKVQKLLALTTSTNIHEAESAMLKAQELLLKHNLDTSCINSCEEKVVLRRILGCKKRSTKLSAIAHILSTFFVNVIFRGGQELTYLEISGSLVNVDIAEYVANFLDRELERLWDLARSQHDILKGLLARNSFFDGIAQGYCNKVMHLKKDLSTDMCYALVLAEHNLSEMKDLIYPKLGFTKSHRKTCSTSSGIGEQIGKNLQIKPAIQTANNQNIELIYKK